MKRNQLKRKFRKLLRKYYVLMVILFFIIVIIGFYMAYRSI
jgi:TRAP-type C4-dicarboxylate transport system permease small subunit